MNNKIIAFTDGSSLGNPGDGGWGAIIIYPNEQVFELGGKSEEKTTNNRMEMTAVIEVLKKLSSSAEATANKENGDGELVIHTDSSYLINGITKWVYGWMKRDWKTATGESVLNRDLWEETIELKEKSKSKISWEHIRGHRGVVGNERADEIATGFAEGERPKLYNGELGKYGMDILNFSMTSDVKKTSSSKSKKAYSYLSLVDNVLVRHKTWEECEKRVKGVKGAKFKKAINEEDEKEILKGWGR